MTTVSMDESLDTGEDTESANSLHDVIGADGDMPDVLGLEILPGLLTKLTSKQREVIRLRYVEGLNHKQIGRELRVSERTVKAVETSALARMRGFVKDGEGEA